MFGSFSRSANVASLHHFQRQQSIPAARSRVLLSFHDSNASLALSWVSRRNSEFSLRGELPSTRSFIITLPLTILKTQSPWVRFPQRPVSFCCRTLGAISCQDGRSTSFSFFL
ncbi:hypothetical protein AVEN_37456-1 [Araneus ventricosus]|uniref:Uncharacterized protein n=1 Tax=Araneus ventricosus TaxID=182803 RepID=A0A4Y2FAW5_ARAVE|nr:hypothetical protein AVEN_37456-1 [Araneus ventricosus]